MFFFITPSYFLLFRFVFIDCLGSLHIVVLQEALEVQNGNLFPLLNIQKLTQGSIRIDVLLVVQAVLLHVVHDATGHVRAAHLCALGLAKKHAQIVRDLLGLREHGGLLGYRVARLIHCRSPSAAAAAGTLELTGKTLLHLLQVAQHHAKLVAELVHLCYLSIELGHKADLILSGSSGGSRSSHGGRHRGSTGSGSLRGTARRSRCCGYRGDLLLLGGGGLRGLGNSCGRRFGCSLRAHFILVVGLFRGFF